jgi:signal transduction histidine kinase
MPEMTGFEMCDSLKADCRLAAVPVIFLSALDAVEDKVRGLDCGGVDYITKPFQLDEVRARVKTHLQIHNLQRELKQYTGHLEGLVQARTRELTEAQARLQVLDRAKTDFLMLISHELNTPLNGLLGIGEVVLDMLPEGQDAGELRNLFEQSRQRMTGIVENALLLTQIQVAAENFELEPIPFDSILQSALERAAPFAHTRQVSVRSSPIGRILVLGEPRLMAKAMQSLIETAVKFSMPGQSVNIASGNSADAAYALIQTETGHIAPAAMDRFFDILSVSEAITPGGEFGLDPAIAYRILKLFGGSATVENREPSGIRIAGFFRVSN